MGNRTSKIYAPHNDDLCFICQKIIWCKRVINCTACNAYIHITCEFWYKNKTNINSVECPKCKNPHSCVSRCLCITCATKYINVGGL